MSLKSCLKIKQGGPRGMPGILVQSNINTHRLAKKKINTHMSSSLYKLNNVFINVVEMGIAQLVHQLSLIQIYEGHKFNS
jgi:hypothetical protein